MPNITEGVEIVTGRERRRRYSAEHKLTLVEETMLPGMTAVARIHGVAPSLPFKWRRLMIQGGQMARPAAVARTTAPETSSSSLPSPRTYATSPN